MALNSFGDITGSVAAKLEKQALEHAKYYQVLSTSAKKFSLPKNNTDTIRMRRAIPYTVANTPLTEGVPPSSTDIRYEVVDISLLQYGGYTEVTDILVDLHTTPVLSDINMLNAEQAAATKEALLWGKLKAATNVQYAGAAASLVTTNSVLDVGELQAAVKTLNRNKARKVTSIVTGGVKVNTSPVEASFIAYLHTDAEPLIRAMAGFTPVSQYGTMQTISQHEFGAVENVRFITSPDLDYDAGLAASSKDAYTCIITGQDSYGCLNLAGAGVFTPVVRSVGKPSKSDPLGQTGSVGYKMYSAEAVLNQDWLVNVKFVLA
jgi:N4-gp56 family major capsid protein